MGRRRTRVHRDRPGRPRGRQLHRRVLLHPDGDGHRHRLDDQPVGAEQGGHLGVRGAAARDQSVPLPPILGIDSDNGSEFINHHLVAYCAQHRITFTRSRPGNKNDGAHVEQKNWTHVRELVGYLRFDTEAELQVLNAIWALDQRFTNHLLAQQKLVHKQRHGSKVTKRYDIAQTPLARVLVDERTPTSTTKSLRAKHRRIHPGDLYREIAELTHRLERLALSKAPAPVRPPVNRSFNQPRHPEVLGEAMNQASRRI